MRQILQGRIRVSAGVVTKKGAPLQYHYTCLLTLPERNVSSHPMRLTVNGEPQEIPDETSIAGLLKQLGLTGPVAVELNAQVIPRAEHESSQLKDEDVVEIVHFVGGG